MTIRLLERILNSYAGESAVQKVPFHLADSLRYFTDPPPNCSIPSALSSGLRDDIFLTADASAIASLRESPSDPYLDTKSPAPNGPPIDTSHLIAGYITASETSYDISKTYDSDFRGSLKVHPAHVATTFFQRHWPVHQEKGSEDWWEYQQSMETMFVRARGLGRRRGDVYPPASWDN